MIKFTGSFRYNQWDPWLLIAQIVAVQCILYTTLGLLLTIFGNLSGDTRTLDHIFEYHEINVRDVAGKVVILAFVINSLLGSLALWFLVERTKLCLDFSCTWHFLHLIMCCFYNGAFPTTFSWWALNIACITLMCVSGEFLCLRAELQAIPLSLGPKTDL